MSRINEKLGLRPVTRRRGYMNLPTDRAARVALTAAQCPQCGQRDVREHVIHGRRTRTCSWCGQSWCPEVDA